MSNKQAIVIIHGIGEQRPILTLRGLVESLVRHLREVKKEARENEAVFWDKPDPVAGNFETRRMEMRKGQRHPTTHFYEFYWAHHMRDTNFSHIKAWLKRVVFRNPKKISERLRPVFYFFWFLILLVLVSIVVAIRYYGPSAFIGIVTGTVGTIVLGILSVFLFNYLGDAARYLDPVPGNIGERQAIRAEGLALLRQLHESERYSRIIVVGHSLGAAIGYDLIKLLWAEYYFKFDANLFLQLPDADVDSHFANLESVLKTAKALEKDKTLQDVFRNGQTLNLNYLRSIGNPWLISDFVTLGSPLAHAGHLFAQEKDLFEKLKLQREYPICPAYIDSNDKDWFRPKASVVNSNGKVLKYFTHSSPFAVTIWTNIYYNTDFVGGATAPLFGNGVKDIEIDAGKKLFVYPKGHTRYWDFENQHNVLSHLWDIIET